MKTNDKQMLQEAYSKVIKSQLINEAHSNEVEIEFGVGSESDKDILKPIYIEIDGEKYFIMGSATVSTESKYIPAEREGNYAATFEIDDSATNISINHIEITDENGNKLFEIDRSSGLKMDKIKNRLVKIKAEEELIARINSDIDSNPEKYAGEAKDYGSRFDREYDEDDF